MKFFEKMMALLLSLAAVLSFAMPAFAEDEPAPTAAGTHTITISFEKPGHEYVAYQVFKGDYYKAGNEEKGHLSNIEWGSGVNGTGLLEDLQSEQDFKAAKTAADVAYILEGYDDNGDKLDAFAKVVAKHLSNVVAGTSKQKADAVNGKYEYSISVTGDGYYFVQDKNTVTGKDDANTKYILQVLGNVQINAKADVPDIEKKITNADGTNPRKGDSYNVGDTVCFELTSKVPDMDGYDSYTYKVTDTLSDGLTLVQENGKPKVTITIGGETYTGAFEATLDADKNVLTIEFTNFITQKDKAGEVIVIRYEAVLNEKALQKDKENNSVYLEYSNDPHDTGTGKTTEKKTYVYNFDIDIVKHETGDNNKLLSGAEFVLYRINDQGKKEYYYYDSDPQKTEWKTLTPDDLETIQAAAAAGEITSKTTNEDGESSFTGLEEGIYYLQEIKAPDGYNLPADPVKVEITVNYNEDGTINMETSLVKKRENNGHMFVKQEIENKPGPVLPSTGGIGTTIFYVLGGILTVAAIVLLIVKKRMENTKR